MSEKDNAGACYIPVQEHSCEICGMSGLTDDLMREHTRTCHIEGNAQCPFCGFSGVAPAELLLHVNQAHLDYLTPENELMSFIDDQSPSVDGDSDSLSECRGLSPQYHHAHYHATHHHVHHVQHSSQLQQQHYQNQNNQHLMQNHLHGIGSSAIATMSATSGIAAFNGLATNTNKVNASNDLNSTGISISVTEPIQSTVTAGLGIAASNATSIKSITTAAINKLPACSMITNQNGNRLLLDNVKNLNNHMPSCSNSNNSMSHHPQANAEQPQAHDPEQQQNHENEQQKSNEAYKNCDMMNGSSSTSSSCSSKEAVNGFDLPNGGGQGSPSRSQLGLKLKSHAPATRKQSPLQCPLCPYTSDNANILEEHINRSHFDPLSPSVNNSNSSNNHLSTLNALQCPICARIFESASDLELHVNIEHRDILSPGKVNTNESAFSIGQSGNICPVCSISLENMKPPEMEMHIEGHFTKSPKNFNFDGDLEKEAQKLREQREFELLRAQYGMDDQGNFREQSAAAMQRAVYAGEMSVADYYERQVGLRAAESHGIDDGTSCTKSVAARVLSLSSSSPGVIKSLVCSSVDHYASSYGDKGWGCGYRNLQMLLSSLLQNTTFNEALYSAWGTQGPSRTAMPSISRLQKMVEAAWAQGFDVQGSEQLGCKLYNTRKWIGATEVVTVLSWLRINCQLIDFHRPTSSDGRHPELFNWVLRYFDEPRVHTPPLYLQHQGHSRTIIGIEQRASGLTLLVLDPSHGPRQVAALGSSQDSLRLIRRGPSAMRAPQYQIVAVRGLIETEEQYQASKVLRSLRIPPDR